MISKLVHKLVRRACGCALLVITSHHHQPPSCRQSRTVPRPHYAGRAGGDDVAGWPHSIGRTLAPQPDCALLCARMIA